MGVNGLPLNQKTSSCPDAIAIWIGYHSDSGSFGWTDNSPIDYTNFNTDPSPDGHEQCNAYFAIGGNGWLIQPCNVNDINGVVCKQPANV
uniref:C-type lectin domain-containing protein n=1 Tax=Acrobeloides nanus TaxID=290746 RepID=A0A914CMB1_9BILA